MSITGETVTVRTYTGTGVDAFNDVTLTSATEVVGNVLVGPGRREDLHGADRPDGVKVAYNLHFPKTFTADLRGAEIQVRGEWFHVIGDPKPYTPENTPGAWNLPVEVKRVDG